MRVLSGIQSSGKLHLGNYLGAMKQYLRMIYNSQTYQREASSHEVHRGEPYHFPMLISACRE